jgi:hypothetical protein
MAFSTKISRTLLAPGVKSLRSYLQSELNVLRRAPVLLISSEAGAVETSSNNIKAVADSCQWMKFTLGQQFAMRTVSTTISSAFPTKDSLEQTLELMQRTGASSVVSVGSGAAMDLGKAVQANLVGSSCSSSSNSDGAQNTSKNTPLILVPTTYSGILAAGASHSLFLDAEEDTLVPLPQHHQGILAAATPDGTGAHHATVSTLEPQTYMEHLDADKFDVLLYAVSAILVDAGLRKSTHLSLPILLQDTIDLISLRDTINTPTTTTDSDVAKVSSEMMALTTPLMNLLYQSAGLLSYGLSSDGGFDEEDNRSITLALGSSLIPTLFPETHPLSFIASLAPGICRYYSEQQQQQQPRNNIDNDANEKLLGTLVDRLQDQFSGGGNASMRSPPSLVPNDESLQGFSVPDMALSHIQTNQAVWNPLDFPDDVLVEVLQHCMKQQ